MTTSLAVDSGSSSMKNGASHESLYGQLQQEIQKHEQMESDQGMLAHCIAAIYNPGKASLDKLKNIDHRAQSEGKSDNALKKLGVEAAIKEDRSAAQAESDVCGYGAGFIKAVPLFMAPGKGLGLAGAFYALDEVRQGSSKSQKATDYALGFAKGVLLKQSLETFALSAAPVWQKGAVLGGVMSGLDSALSSRTWYDSTSNRWDVGKGMSDIGRSVALGSAVGAVSFPLAGKTAEFIGTKCGIATRDEHLLVGTMLTGSGFGFVSGATGETLNELHSSHGLDPMKIAGRGAVESASDMFAAGLAHRITFASQARTFEWHQGAPTSEMREFKVDKVEDEYGPNASLAGLSHQGAMATVRERLQQGTGWRRLLGLPTFGEPTQMFIQHVPHGKTINPTADSAQLIASCNLEGGLKAKSVFPHSSDVYMQVGTDRIRLTPEYPKVFDDVRIRKLGSYGPNDRVWLNGQIFKPGTEIVQPYLHVVRQPDGRVFARGRTASDGVWLPIPNNQNRIVGNSERVYFGSEDASQTVQSAKLAPPGKEFKLQGRVIGVEQNRQVYIRDEGSRDGTLIRMNPNYFYELQPEHKMILSGKIHRPQANYITNVLERQQTVQQSPRINLKPAAPGNGQIGSRVIAAMPAPVARAGNPQLSGERAPMVVPDVKPLRDLVISSVKTDDPGFTAGQYFDVVLKNAVGGALNPRALDASVQTIEPFYNNYNDARASARFIAGVFRRRLTNPADPGDRGPRTWADAVPVTAGNGLQYFRPTIKIDGIGEGFINLERNLVPHGISSTSGYRQIRSR